MSPISCGGRVPGKRREGYGSSLGTTGSVCPLQQGILVSESIQKAEGNTAKRLVFKNDPANGKGHEGYLLSNLLPSPGNREVKEALGNSGVTLARGTLRRGIKSWAHLAGSAQKGCATPPETRGDKSCPVTTPWVQPELPHCYCHELLALAWCSPGAGTRFIARAVSPSAC